MITVTQSAISQIKQMIEARGGADLALHLAIKGRGPDGFDYAFKFVSAADAHPDDRLIKGDGVKVYLDHASLDNLRGATLDFYGLGRGSFHIENPNALWTTDLARRVQQVVVEKINPGIALHGGFVTLVDVRDKDAYIEFGGGCMGCGASQMTLKLGIERLIRQEVPEVGQIIDVTDHDAGTNPFYARKEAGESPLVG